MIKYFAADYIWSDLPTELIDELDISSQDHSLFNKPTWY